MNSARLLAGKSLRVMSTRPTSAISAASASAAPGDTVLDICSSMIFLIVWAVSYHIGESDRLGQRSRPPGREIGTIADRKRCTGVGDGCAVEIPVLAGDGDVDPRT